MPVRGRALAVSVIAFGLMLGCRPEPATAPPTPVASPASRDGAVATEASLDEHLRQLDVPDTRASALAALGRVAEGTRDAAARQALVDALVPALLRVWDDAGPHHLTILRLALALEHPGAAPLWNRAIGLDGSAAGYDATLLALAGVTRTGAAGSLEAVLAQLQALVASPALDALEPAGQVRVAMIEALVAIGSRRAVPTLVTVLEQGEAQPVAVHRAAADALGRFADPSAVDALVTAPFRVPDVFATTNLPERAKAALAGIGAPAVPRVVAVLDGEHAGVRELAAKHGLEPDVLELSAASLLGAIGSRQAVEPLLRHFPTEGCKGGGSRRRSDAALGAIMRRAMIANALGLIGDEAAVPALCSCATASREPTDMDPIVEALGRIGGRRATACLVRTMKTGRYDLDAVAGPAFVHEIRWRAARAAIMATDLEGLPAVEAALDRARRDPAVSRELAPLAFGAELLRNCERERSCGRDVWLRVLADPVAPAPTRELAAIRVARLAPGDAEVALAIARSFSVPDPDARVTMAWLSAHVMAGARCQACADELAQQLERSLEQKPPAEYQLSVLVARTSIARLREPLARP